MVYYLKIIIFISLLILISSELVCENKQDSVYKCYEKTTEYNCFNLSDKKIICKNKNLTYECQINNYTNEQTCIKYLNIYYFLNYIIIWFLISIFIKLLPHWLSIFMLKFLLADIIISYQ